LAEKREFICITCPVGCTIEATVEGEKILSIRGQGCKRGIAFVKEELTAPKRMLTTTVQVRGGKLPLVPVRSREPLPKDRLFDIVAQLRQIVLQAPVAEHQIVLENAANTGVDIITSRAIPKQENPS